MRRLLLFCLLLLCFESKAQKRDSRSVAMVGATTTIADGIYACLLYTSDAADE